MTTRKERVVLEMESNIAPVALRDAAAVRILNEEVNRLSRSAVDSRRVSRELAAGNQEVERSAQRAERSIDQYSGRLSLLLQTVGAFGPGFVPIAAVGIPAVTGLASSLGFAALGVGVLVGAFQGLGDALKAVNKAQLEPTAENLDAARLAMSQLSPEARTMVRELRTFIPALKELRDTAGAGLFPGLAEGLDQLEGALPAVERIVAAVSGELGDLAADGGADLASARWADFFTFLEREAPQALDDMARGTGNIAHALAELWMAFEPLDRDFSSGLLHVTEDLDKWATGLSKTAGFQEFIGYIEANGPQVASTLGAIANAALQIVEAAAPLGGPVLHVLELMANTIAAVADSDLGTPIMSVVTALSALRLAQSAFGKTQEYAWGRTAKSNVLGFGAAITTVTTAQQRATMSSAQLAKVEKERATAARAGLATVGKSAALVAGLAIASSGAADKIGLTNTASLALMGTMAMPGWGTAIGGATGFVMDLTHANDGLNDSLAQLNAMAGKVDLGTFNQQLEATKKQIDDLEHVTGLGDALSDTAKAFGYALLHPGKGHQQQVGEAQGKQDAAQATEDAALRERGAAAANRAVAASSQLAAHGYQLTAAGAREAALGVAQFTSSVKGANAALARQGTLDAYKTALLDFRDSLKQNGKTLDSNTRAGLANRAALRTMAGSALEYAGNMKNAAKRTEFLQSARKDFINAAVAARKTRAAARGLADMFGLVDRIHAQPKVEEKGSVDSKARIARMRAEIERLKPKTVQVNQKGADDAKTKIAQLKAAIAALRDRQVHIDVVRRYSGNAGIGGAGQVTGARGMLWVGGVQHYAYGDVANRHQAELAGPGTARVWREEETKGEAYIPLADDDRRPRARSIAEETVGILGGDVMWFADGGRRGGHPVRGGGGVGKHRLKEFNEALAKATKSLEKERTVRDDIVSKRQELASAVTGGLTHDIFGEKSSNFAWMSQADRNKQLTGDTFTTLRGDTATGKKFKALVANLKSRGVDGQALAEIISRGDIDLAQAMASMSTSDLRSYKSLYNERASVLASVGRDAGTAAYGAQQAAANKHLATLNTNVKHLQAEIKHLRGELSHHPKKTGEEVGKHINHAAGNAAKRGHK